MQVEVAKKIMFEQQKEESVPRKNNRRETWCPGRSAWAPPLGGKPLTPAALASCADRSDEGLALVLSKPSTGRVSAVLYQKWRQSATRPTAFLFPAEATNRKRPLHAMSTLDEDANSLLMSAIGEEGEFEQQTSKSARHSMAAGAAACLHACGPPGATNCTMHLAEPVW